MTNERNHRHYAIFINTSHDTLTNLFYGHKKEKEENKTNENENLES